jgi:hypothetical protein
VGQSFHSRYNPPESFQVTNVETDPLSEAMTDFAGNVACKMHAFDADGVLIELDDYEKRLRDCLHAVHNGANFIHGQTGQVLFSARGFCDRRAGCGAASNCRHPPQHETTRFFLPSFG